MTNTFPVHGLDSVEEVVVDVPAAFVRADDLGVERLEQRFLLIEVAPEQILFHYKSSTFDFECELRYDSSGLVVYYPVIATRES